MTALQKVSSPTIYEKFNDIVNRRMNYDRVKKTMLAFNWTWLGEKDPPEVDRMKMMLGRLFDTCIAEIEKGENSSCASSGGFSVTILDKEDVFVTFSPEQYYE